MSSRHAPRGPVKGTHPIDSGNPMDAVRAIRCKATNRAGKQCGRRPIPGGSVCVMHGGKAPQVQQKAKERLLFMQCKALDTIDTLMDRDEFPSVQFQAAKAVVDWTEGKARETVDMSVSGDEALIAALAAGRKRVADSRKAE